MDATVLIKSGNLVEARKTLTDQVKAAPADTRKRVLLFQVLLFSGEWDKAERHIDIVGGQNVKSELGSTVYKKLIQSEKERHDIAAHPGKFPSIIDTPPYMDLYSEAIVKLFANDIESAKVSYGKLLEILPEVSGTLNGNPFTGVQDTDAVFSLFLEAFTDERYMWVPFESIRELVISPPQTMFDLIWASARLTTWKGLTMNCFLPVIYPDSFRHEDDRLKLGRMTDWKHLGGPFSRGIGQHVFEIGEKEVSILEIQELNIHQTNIVSQNE